MSVLEMEHDQPFYEVADMIAALEIIEPLQASNASIKEALENLKRALAVLTSPYSLSAERNILYREKVKDAFNTYLDAVSTHTRMLQLLKNVLVEVE